MYIRHLLVHAQNNIRGQHARNIIVHVRYQLLKPILTPHSTEVSDLAYSIYRNMVTGGSVSL